MNWLKVTRFIKRLTKIKTKKIRVLDNSKLSKSSSSRFVNCNITLRGNSILIVDDNVTLINCNININNTTFEIGNECNLLNLTIDYANDSEVKIDKNVKISNYNLQLNNAQLKIGKECIFTQGRNSLTPEISINNGALIIDKNNVIKADFSIRFGGMCKIGIYNCINERTEIRCDESISIGNFNMISYECSIWDTNTHCIHPVEIRREITIKYYPLIGFELEKPITRPIIIGNDTWIGQNSSILKGSIIDNCVTVGTKAIVTGLTTKNNDLVVGNPAKIK